MHKLKNMCVKNLAKKFKLKVARKNIDRNQECLVFMCIIFAIV